MAKNPKMVMCRNCNTAMAANVKKCPACGAKNKKPFYQKWWFILIIIIAIIGVLASKGRNDGKKFSQSGMEVSIEAPKETKQTESSETNEDMSDTDTNEDSDTDNTENSNMDNNHADTGEPTETQDTNAELVDGMRPEFKEAMDSYEEFYKNYCDVVKKYSDNPTDLSLLSEYTKLVEQSVEVSEKFDAWDEGELNDAELKYYLEVNERVIQMMSEAGM